MILHLTYLKYYECLVNSNKGCRIWVEQVDYIYLHMPFFSEPHFYYYYFIFS